MRIENKNIHNSLFPLKRNAGFTFVLAIISVVIAGIVATSAITLVSTSLKREKEAELVYRLGKVRTALKEYRKKYNRYPSHLEELLVNRYLRTSSLIDPVTGKEWAPIHAEFSEGFGIKDIRSSSNEPAIRTKDGLEVKHSEL